MLSCAPIKYHIVFYSANTSVIADTPIFFIFSNLLDKWEYSGRKDQIATDLLSWLE